MLNHNKYNILRTFVVAAIVLVAAILSSGCAATDGELLPSLAVPKPPSCTATCDADAARIGPAKAAECVKACFAKRGITETVVGAEYAREATSSIWSCDVAYPYEQYDTLTNFSVGVKQIHRQMITITYGTQRIGETNLYTERFSAPTHDLVEFLHHNTVVFRGAVNPYAPDIRGRLQSLAWSYAKESAPLHPNRYKTRRYGVRTFDIGGQQPLVVCWQPLVETEPDRSSWPKAGVWQSRRAIRTPVAATKPVPKARKWDVTKGAFVDVVRGDATTYTCKKEIAYREKVPTSDGDGWEPGSVQRALRGEDLVIGPMSHADSQMEAALRHDAKIDTKILVGFSGTCWPTGAKKPEQPSNWSGQYTW